MTQTLLESLKQDCLRMLEILGILQAKAKNMPPILPPEPPVNPTTTTTPPLSKPVETSPITKSLTVFCNAIRDYEGSPGDRNYRNNNPGNCRYSSVGYLSMYGDVKRDPQNFAIFRDYATGFLYLQNLVREKTKRNPNQTIYQFMQVYAPSGDGNDPLRYATFLAHALGVTIDYPMKNIV